MKIIFLYPQYFYFLLVIPLYILVHFISLRARRSNALKFANFEAIARIRGVDLLSKNMYNFFISLSIAVLIILSLSGIAIEREQRVSDFSFALLVDSSQSMEANDMFPTRIEVAKETAVSFVDKLPVGTRIGIISFSGGALIEQSITDDKSMIKYSIENINVSSIGGTDMFRAVVTATNVLQGEDNKAIVMLSDGQINVGNLNDTIDYILKNKLLVNTIALGTKEGGTTSYGISTVDENSLKAMSFATGGIFLRASNKDELNQAFDNILGFEYGVVRIELRNYLLIIAVILVVLSYLVSSFRGRL